MNEEPKTIKNKVKTKRFTRRMQAKLLLVFCVIVGLLIALIVRLTYLAATDKYKKQALELRSYITSEVPCKRGDILDRNGEVLATSVLYYKLILDPTVINYDQKYIDPTIEALHAAYGLDRNELRKIITDKKDNAYVVLSKNLTYDDKQRFTDHVASLEKDVAKYVKGVWFEDEYKRVYPYGSLASHVIGFTVSGNTGTYGVEQYYNDSLSGTNGRSYGYYDSELNIVETVNPATDGNTVVTTVDINVQRVVQDAVEGFLKKYGALNAAAVVMDAYNGEILAMQSNFSYDLNAPRNLKPYHTDEEISAMNDQQQLDALYAMWRNFCISDAYEPGSIYKPFTVAAALEESVVSTRDTFVCDGGEDFPGDIRIKCSRKKGHGEISLAQSIMFSCNDALMQIAAKEGRDIFNSYQEDYCIGSITGIDLPGEASGRIFTKKELNGTELATSSFGQGFTTTMIQMASSFSALINGGIYYQPHVVKRIQNSAGAAVTKVSPLVVNKTTSAFTSEFIKESLYLTVSDGTGKKANLEGYKIGGKTGTSQKLPRDAEKYLVSFLGFIESGDRCIIIYCIVDECKDQEKASTSDTAIELFNEIADRSLPYLKIYPEGEIDYHIEIILPEDLETEEGFDPSGNDETQVISGD
jgi:stage V sporulation protein D (sporulation-specific penicillin-binding protein)